MELKSKNIGQLLDITIFAFMILYLIGPVRGVTTQSMVGYWKLDGNAGDFSGYYHNGTFHNGPICVTGQVGQCLYFDGSNDYVTLDNSDSRLTICNAITLEAWIKGDNFGSGYRYIYDKNGSHIIAQHYKEVPKPVGIWSFDNNANDKSGCGHNGTPVHGPTYTEGKINQSMNFDGFNDHVLIDNRDSRLTLRDAVTIEAWIKGNHFGIDFHHIFDKYGSYTLSVKNGKLAMSGAGGWWHPSSTTLKAHRWYHVVGTFDGSEKRLYMNGVLKASSPQKGTMPSGFDIRISHEYYSFDGLIDEVKVYDRALSAREVLVCYEAGSQ